MFKEGHTYELYKENVRIKQVLKENGCQESIISKNFKRITNNHSLPQLPTATNASHRYPRRRDQMNKNLPYVESTSAKLRRILRSNKVR